jgi:hypothetical protein
MIGATACASPSFHFMHSTASSNDWMKPPVASGDRGKGQEVLTITAQI